MSNVEGRNSIYFIKKSEQPTPSDINRQFVRTQVTDVTGRARLPCIVHLIGVNINI
jgi:hypothetical protein